VRVAPLPRRPRHSRRRLTGIESTAAGVWSAGDYERLAERLAPVHAALVDRLRPTPEVRWLDVATGTGAVAWLAAERGAETVGIDIAPRMIERARRRGDGVRFDVGDAQALPYDDASFDVVSSSFGVIFAPSHEAVARELARVCRVRLGMTSWVPDADMRGLYASFGFDTPEGREPFRWGRDDYVRDRLGRNFEIEIEHDTWYLDAPSGAAVWELWSTSAPPFRALVESLADEPRAAFRRAYIDNCESFRVDGGVRVPREYLLILGRRR
jgi:SAM-dependent methyltransferase